MEKSKEKVLNNFIGSENNEQKKEVLNKKEGLIERVDKVFVTQDGRQLLREQY